MTVVRTPEGYLDIAAAPATEMYIVSPGGPFTSVQAAVDKAVADGHTSFGNGALVLILPGNYIEDVVLPPFINLRGLADASFNTQIGGSLSFVPFNGAGGFNSIQELVFVNPTLGVPCATFDGIVPWQIWMNKVFFQGNNALGPIMDCTNAAGTVIVAEDLRVQNVNVAVAASALSLSGPGFELRCHGDETNFSRAPAIDEVAVRISDGTLQMFAGNIDGSVDVSNVGTFIGVLDAISTGTVPCLNSTTAGAVILANMALDTASAAPIVTGTGACTAGEVNILQPLPAGVSAFDPALNAAAGVTYLQVETGGQTYVPAAPADWSAINPTSIWNALDRIAAVLTPIP